MEVSAAILIKTSDKSLAQFIYSMWDEETQPLDEDDIALEFKGLFSELEFEETPTNIELDGNNLLAFFDCMNGMHAIDDLTTPYLNSAIDSMLLVITGDEGEEWFKLEKNKVKDFRPKHNDNDLFQALRLNAGI